MPAGEKEELDKYLEGASAPQSTAIVYPEDWDKIAKKQGQETGIRFQLQILWLKA
jgi:hypothetical protein